MELAYHLVSLFRVRGILGQNPVFVKNNIGNSDLLMGNVLVSFEQPEEAKSLAKLVPKVKR
jgi:hypothetical protein